MPGPSNSDNLIWNQLHMGDRVPVNDTDIEGKPAALYSGSSHWSPGSVNRAVRTTLILNQNDFTLEDLEDGDNGTLSLHNIYAYVNRYLLYGYKADAYLKSAGDMLSYRAYPTATVNVTFEYMKACTNCYDWNLDGTLGSVLSSWIYLKASAVINYIVGYDVLVPIEYDSMPYILKIAAGYKEPTHYSIDGIDYFELPQGGMFFTEAIPATETTYTLSTDEPLPQPAYHSYPTTIDAIVTLEEIYADCEPEDWLFGPVVRTGGISDTHLGDPIAAIYADPLNADREIKLRCDLVGHRLGQRLTDMQPNQVFTNGFEMAMGYNSTATICYTSELTEEAIAGQYLWEGTLTSINGTDVVFLVDTIWKITQAGLLEGERTCLGPPDLPDLPSIIQANTLAADLSFNV